MELAYLQRFCATDDIRSYLLQPMAYKGRLFASNGHIIVSVPDTFQTQHEPMPDILIPFITRSIKTYAKSGGYFPVTDIIMPGTAPCKDCDGKGTIWADPCDDCEGWGQFEWGEHRYDCKKCNGTGKDPDGQNNREDCPSCYGTAEDKSTPVRVGAGHFQRRYIELILPLPDCEIATDTKHPASAAAYFRFTDGWGTVMPFRVS